MSENNEFFLYNIRVQYSYQRKIAYNAEPILKSSASSYELIYFTNKIKNIISNALFCKAVNGLYSSLEMAKPINFLIDFQRNERKKKRRF